MGDLLTTGELAHLAKLAPETIRRFIDAGEIAAIRTGSGQRLVERAVAEQFLQRRSEQRHALRTR